MVKKKKLLKVKTKKEESGTASSASNQGSESDLAGAVGGMRIGDSQGEASSSSALSPEPALGGTRRLSAASSRSSLMSPTSATSDDSSSRSSAQSVLSPASTSSAYSHAGLRGVAGSVGAGSESDGAWGPVNSPLEGASSPDVSQKTAKIIAKENFLFRRRIFNETKEKQETTDPDYVAYVNHFEITINPKVKIYMYDVRMNIFRDDRTEGKECPSKFRRDALKEFLIQQSITKFPAYDGSHMLYCSAKLSENKTELSDVVHVEEILPGNLTKTIGIKVVVKECQKPSSVQIGDIIEYAKIPSIFNGKTYPQKPIQALEVILLSAGLERDNTFKVGRSIFKVPADIPKPPQDLTGGAEHWSGLFQTIAVGEMPYNSIKSKCQPQFFLCLDAAHCAFRKPQPVTDLKKATALQDFLRGAKIQYEVRAPNVLLTRLMNATGLGRAPKYTESFKFEVNQQPHEGNVAKYFITKYSINLYKDEDPCVKSDKGLLPMRYCTIAARRYQTTPIRNLNRTQISKLCFAAATDPKVRKRYIEENMAKLNLTSQSNCLKEFGISVNKSMATVFGKKVDTPILKYEEICVRGGGTWTINSSVKLLMAGELDTSKPKWLLLALDPRGKPLEGKLLRDVIENIKQYGNNLNMNIPTIDREQKSLDELASVKKEEMIFYQLVFVIMPDKLTPEDPYPEIKQIFELNLNILTQCLKRSTLETTLDVNREKYIQKKDQYFTNLLLKINAKLNGKNHALNKPLCDKKVMVMGADVTHPAPGSTNSPSIAAVTASHENDLFNYNMQWRVQSPKQEIIQEMEKMTQAHLEYYHKKNKSYPERIIFYRDGVGDGQLAAVMNKELLAIQKACSNISTEIQITYLVVQKRNHTRFFSEKNGNVIPGFMVNSKITHPWHRDFYLVSQLCPRGTARPARYRLLHDDASMTDNDVQNMTYSLCMLYSKCAKSISYPTPTYYAHLAAARAKVYFFAIMQDMPTVDFTGLTDEEITIKWEEVSKSVLEKVDTMKALTDKYPMYFI